METDPAAAAGGPRRADHPGRKRLDDHKVLSGILFVLYTGIPWEFLPQELGFGSGMTCWRRLAEWQEAGVWQRLHEVLLAELAPRTLWTCRAPSSTAPTCGRSRGDQDGPSPVDRARPGSKHHLITDAHGIPLAVTLTGGNRNDVTQLIPLIEALPPVARPPRPAPPPPGGSTPTAATTTTSTGDWSGPGITPMIARRRHRARLRPRHLPLGRGAHFRAAALVPSPADPLGDPRRHPRSLPQPRMRHHLLAPESFRTSPLLGPLRRCPHATRGSPVLGRASCLSGLFLAASGGV